MAFKLPSPGLLDLVQIGSGLLLAGPLLIATAIFGSRGELLLAAFTGFLALVALYLPTYIVNRLVPSSLLPSRASIARALNPFKR